MKKKQGLFSRLWQGLPKTRGNVAGRVDELIETTETIDEDFYEDLVDILIMSDMGVRTSDKVIQELKRAWRASGSPTRRRRAKSQGYPQGDHGHAAQAAQMADGDAGRRRERRGQDDDHRQAGDALR